jgi:hypothetical protein
VCSYDDDGDGVPDRSICDDPPPESTDPDDENLSTLPATSELNAMFDAARDKLDATANMTPLLSYVQMQLDSQAVRDAVAAGQGGGLIKRWAAHWVIQEVRSISQGGAIREARLLAAISVLVDKPTFDEKLRR